MHGTLLQQLSCEASRSRAAVVGCRTRGRGRPTGTRRRREAPSAPDAAWQVTEDPQKLKNTNKQLGVAHGKEEHQPSQTQKSGTLKQPRVKFKAPHDLTRHQS